MSGIDTGEGRRLSKITVGLGEGERAVVLRVDFGFVFEPGLGPDLARAKSEGLVPHIGVSREKFYLQTGVDLA